MIFNASMVQMKLGKYEKASKGFDNCKIYTPQRIISYVFDALCLACSQQFVAAIQRLGSALELVDGSNDTSLHDLLCTRAVLYHHQNQMLLALQDLDKALQVMPNSVLALIIKGDTIKYMSQEERNKMGENGKYNELKMYQQAMILDKRTSTKYIGRGFMTTTEGSTDWFTAHFDSMLNMYSQTLSDTRFVVQSIAPASASPMAARNT